MKQITLSIIVSIVLIFSQLSFNISSKKITKETPLWEVLTELGDSLPTHTVQANITGADAKKGEDLVLRGITTNPEGKKVTKQSKHFVCTSCHNIVQDAPSFNQLDNPEARLTYAAEKGIPYLQGSSLYGIVNRTRFYNGDYEKKYGDLVKPARNDLRESIQLCAVECSQGRRLEDWELESIVMYLWTLELKMSDLQLNDDEWKEFEANYQTKKDPKTLATWLKSKYQQGAGATFIDPPKDRKIGLGDYAGNPENGKLIYDLGCKHCHENERYSFFNLDDAKYTFQYLEQNMTKYNRFSVYQVVRYGTKPLNGKRAYMPNYTAEKMSREQMQDLRAYIEQQAK